MLLHEIKYGARCCEQKKAAKACMDYGFHMAVTSWSAKVAADMATLVKKGINSFKFFLAYKVIELWAAGAIVFICSCIFLRLENPSVSKTQMLVHKQELSLPQFLSLIWLWAM